MLPAGPYGHLSWGPLLYTDAVEPPTRRVVQAAEAAGQRGAGEATVSSLCSKSACWLCLKLH